MRFIIMKQTPDGPAHVRCVLWPKEGWLSREEAEKACPDGCYVQPARSIELTEDGRGHRAVPERE